MIIIPSVNLVKHNTKIKHYTDTIKCITYCSNTIFKDKNFEERKHEIYEPPINDDLIGMNLAEKQMYYETQDISYFTSDDNDDNKLINDVKKYEMLNVREDSLKRAHDKVFDIVFMNDWNYFLTITFDDKIQDASDIEGVTKKVRNWLKDNTKRRGLQYILIPEFHKDGQRVHAHALINDVLAISDSGTVIHKDFKKPVKLSTIKRKGISLEECKTVYNVDNWKYGFSTAIETYGDKFQLARYITKYITKDIKKIFGKFYWSSRNINRDVPVTFDNVDFDEIQAKEYSPKQTNNRYKYEMEGLTSEDIVF